VAPAREGRLSSQSPRGSPALYASRTTSFLPYQQWCGRTPGMATTLVRRADLKVLGGPGRFEGLGRGSEMGRGASQPGSSDDRYQHSDRALQAGNQLGHDRRLDDLSAELERPPCRRLSRPRARAASRCDSTGSVAEPVASTHRRVLRRIHRVRRIAQRRYGQEFSARGLA
jgi:hypothetical protein